MTFCTRSVVFSTFNLFLRVSTCKTHYLPPIFAPLLFLWPASSAFASRDSAYKHLELLQHEVLQFFPCNRVEHYILLAGYPVYAAFLQEAFSKSVLIKAHEMIQLSTVL